MFVLFLLCDGRHFKVDCDFTSSCSVFSVLCLNKCQILGCPVNLQLYTIPTLFCGGSLFSELTCRFQGLLLLAFIPFPGYLISVLLREVYGGEIASHSACLCISLYSDFDSPFTHSSPHSLPAVPPKNPQNLN